MCGLAGYSGRHPVDITKFAWLLRENEIRGKDSTGVHGNFLFKLDSSTSPFIGSKTFAPSIDGAKSVIGHTRAATMGFKNVQNAHPFAHNTKSGVTIIGTHNGVIFDTVLKKLVELYDEKDPSVDSEFIYRVLALENLDYKKVIPLFEGTMALAFKVSNHPDDLYLYRRQSRPLYIGMDTYGEMYYSSLPHTLRLIGMQNIIPLPINILHVFNKGVLKKMIDIPLPKINTLELDQGLTSWETTKATKEELDLIGIKRYVQPSRITGHDWNRGGGSAAFRSRVQSPHVSSQLSLPVSKLNGNKGSVDTPLDEVCNLNLELKQANIFGQNKWTYVGGLGHAYIILKLVTAMDFRISLPGWEVSIEDKGGLTIDTKYTTIKGVTALVIPEKQLKGEFYTLKIKPPGALHKEVSYTTALTNVKGARVLEVTLSIPFRREETQKERANKGVSECETAPRYQYVGERHHNIISQSSDVRRFEERYPTLRAELAALQPLQRNGQKSTGGADLRGAVDRTFKSKPANYLENVIDMDYYTATNTLRDSKELTARIEKLLSDVDPDLAEIQNHLSKTVSFLEHITYNFERYVGECEAEMERDVVHDARNLIPDADMKCEECKETFIPDLTLSCPNCGHDNDPRNKLTQD